LPYNKGAVFFGSILKFPIIAPSLLSADFRQLREEISEMDESGADWHHVDVMDAHFVPNLAFSSDIQSFLFDLTQKPIDTHLMMTHPLKYCEDFVAKGSKGITVHVECEQPLEEIFSLLESLKVRCGISLKPNTPIERLEPWLGRVDLVLVMTVEPGFGGQTFMPQMLQKIEWLKNYRDEHRLDYYIEVDGGINKETGRQCFDAGANVLVAGSYLYKANDRKAAIASLRF